MDSSRFKATKIGAVVVVDDGGGVEKVVDDVVAVVDGEVEDIITVVDDDDGINDTRVLLSNCSTAATFGLNTVRFRVTCCCD